MADRAPRSLFVVKALRQKTMLVSLLRRDERMLVMPYLISMMTPESPGLWPKEQRHRGFRFIQGSSITYSSAQSPPPAVASAAPTTAGEEGAIGR